MWKQLVKDMAHLSWIKIAKILKAMKFELVDEYQPESSVRIKHEVFDRAPLENSLLL